MRRLPICAIALGLSGCGSIAPDTPKTTGNTPHTAQDSTDETISWYPLRTSNDGRSITIAVLYQSCRPTHIDAESQETRTSVDITVTRRNQTEIAAACQPLRTVERSIDLTSPLDGRLITGTNIALGTFGHALGNVATSSTTPSVVGMRADQATQTLCRWGLRATFPAHQKPRDAVTSQAPESGARLPPATSQQDDDYSEALGKRCEPAPTAGTPVLLQTQE